MPWYDLHEQKVISEKEAQTLHRYHGPGRVQWRDDCEDWEIADKQTLVFGTSDFNILLTTEIQPFTTLKEYLQAKAMTEATRRYENSPERCKHLTMLQAGLYDFECSRHMFIYTQHFLAHYRKPLAAAPPVLEPAPAPAPAPEPAPMPTPLPPLGLLRNLDADNSKSTGGSSFTRSQRNGARMGRINRGAHKRLQRRK